MKKKLPALSLTLALCLGLTVPALAAPAPAVAYPTGATVTVDGQPIVFNAYTVKDANGYDTNYVKLRDVAQTLNGTAAQFRVDWNGSITVTTQTAYIPNGTEMINNFEGEQGYTMSTSSVTIDGQAVELEAILLTDAGGGGFTYFKLRDLGAALGFTVGWTAETGITIDTTQPED